MALYREGEVSMFYVMIALAIFGLMGTVPAKADGPKWEPFVSNVDGTTLDLAPPAGFVEICGQDAQLCHNLTAGYPPSTKTLGYFVLSEEWKQFRKERIGFSRYLIAQLAISLSPDDLPGLKKHILSNQGSIPDHTSLVKILELKGRAPIGVFLDTADAIAFGQVLKLRMNPPAPPKDIILASTNVALAVKGKMLSLYAFDEVAEDMNVEAVKELTRKWLECLRAANAR